MSAALQELYEVDERYATESGSNGFKRRYPDWCYGPELTTGRLGRIVNRETGEVLEDRFAFISRIGGANTRELPNTVRFQAVRANKYQATHGEHPDCVAIYRSVLAGRMGRPVANKDIVLVSFTEALAMCAPHPDSLVYQTAQQCSWDHVPAGKTDYHNGQTFLVDLQGTDLNGERFDFGIHRAFVPDAVSEWLVRANSVVGDKPEMPDVSGMSEENRRAAFNLYNRRSAQYYHRVATAAAYELVIDQTDGRGFESLADIQWYLAHFGAAKFPQIGPNMAKLRSAKVAMHVGSEAYSFPIKQGERVVVGNMDELKAALADNKVATQTDEFALALYNDLKLYREYRQLRAREQARRDVEYRALQAQLAQQNAEQETEDIPF